MNKTKIEWADYTWSPVTGCNHACEYCYARGIARRFKASDANANYIRDRNGEYNEILVSLDGKPYPAGFKPTFYDHRLDEPSRMKKPQNIFVCSMADLFGGWVPDEWIKAVFEACEAAPWHRYLFLTKNGQRYEQIGLLPDRDNFWYGTTRTGANSRLECGASDHRNTFLSLEPLLAPIGDETLGAIELWGWVIIGAMSGPGSKNHQPRREWVENIVNQCRATGVPVFMKNSLADIWGEPLIQEFPWETEG